MFSSAEGQFLKCRDSMGSDSFMNNQTHLQQNNNPLGGGLARYRSAPSSFLAALMDSSTENSSSGDESEALFSALMDGPPDLNQKSSNGGSQMQYPMKQEDGVGPELRPAQTQTGSLNGHLGYESAVVGSYSMSNGNGSNLARQSSSPAGFFNGYGIMREVGNYRIHNNSKASSSAATGMNMMNHMNFSSGPSSSTSRFMPSIPENVNESISTHKLGRANSPQESWNDATFNSLKRNRDVFSNLNGLENQNGETRKNHHGLVHHLSLPKTSSELAEVDKFIQFQPDTVPCQIRAKRGFATHPRSIAERVRRTKISEKMKKLQDLFPNMDKQTSTADMLDLAVQFIKDLQKQVDTLTETKAKCVCSTNKT